MSMEGSGIWLIKDGTRENIRETGHGVAQRGVEGQRVGMGGESVAYGMFSYVPRSELVFTRFPPTKRVPMCILIHLAPIMRGLSSIGWVCH